MPPEYHLESFWDSRFKVEDHFEWLGDGSNTILPFLRKFLRDRKAVYRASPPRLLHIGAGTSTLSDQILAVYKEFYKEDTLKDGVMVNIDYSEVAVERGKLGIQGANDYTRWKRTDLLNWDDVLSLRRMYGSESNEGEEPFSIVVDKSTSDAISCNDSITFDSSKKSSLNLRVARTFLLCYPNKTLSYGPVDLLALHLAALVKTDGIWIVLSYSRHRFDFLITEEGPKESEGETSVAPWAYWKVEDITGIDAPSGLSKVGVFAPAVQHYVFVLRRTQTVFMV
ncbi:unnamed protein product [Somion occarium]|uniref:Uncharacterized protein n=1 Tax=Somion occarium TaxID=3059160 RepID=A0ABP1CET3_9APHY